jgi:hypothetical protein
MSRLERIVAACGGLLLDGGMRALIPGPGHSHKDRSVSLVETEEGRILIHCFSARDDWRRVRRALAERGLLDDRAPVDGSRASWSARKVATQPADEERLARAERIWSESRSIAHTPATVYLRRRAIPEPLWAAPPLRFHPRMTSLDDRARRPGLVAAITNLAGALQGVQVTLLSAHGAAKAPLPTPRRVIGRLVGGAVQLAPIADTLVIAEGVETALSASEALEEPAWAALTAHNLSLFEPPAEVKRLIVAVDNDLAGLSAFQTLRDRLGLTLVVEIAPPPRDADDWNAWACSPP